MRPSPSMLLVVSLFLSIGFHPSSSLADEPAAESQAPASTDPTWDLGDGLEAALVDMVTADVERDLEEGCPWLKLSDLPDYARNPRSLPQPLNGKANEAIWKYVPVILAKGDMDLARSTVELLRDPRANINPKVIYQGNITLSLILSSAASGRKAQESAIGSVLGKLPAKRFFTSTGTLQSLFQAAETERDQELPSMYSSAIENMKTYPMSPESAGSWLRIHYIMKGIWQNLDTWKAVYDELYAQAKATNPHPYRFRTVDMETRVEQANPVVMGIFDSGVDTMRYNMYENPGERPDGLDNDGNGLIDDLSGLVWDWDPKTRHQHSNLDQVEQLPPDLVKEYETYIIGAFDRRAGKESPESQAFIEKIASLSSVEEQKEFDLNMGRIGEWAHGTHVAGLATAGNRWASVASFRFSWTGEGRIYHERGPSDQELRWERESIQELIKWINDHQVRVLNASLGFTVEYQEAVLAKERDVFQPDMPAYGKRDENGQLTPELDLDLIHDRAVKIQEFRRSIWKRLFDGCPDTLFVLAAGNEDHDVMEYQDVPVTIQSEHDNLLIVGAVDNEGDWASFTNFNKDMVQVYDLGVNVLSYSPTGRMIPLSGTSMAAPNAANTAGKLFSLFPDMTPSDVKHVMIDSADSLRAPFTGGIIDEVAAVKLAEKRSAPK